MHNVTRTNHDVSDGQCPPPRRSIEAYQTLYNQLYFVCSQNSDTAAFVFLVHILVYSAAEHKQSLPNCPLFENISVPQPPRLCPCNPPVVTASKLTARTRCLEIQFGIRVDKTYGFISVREFVTWLGCGRFFPT
jgi:hypothetical protein